MLKCGGKKRDLKVIFQLYRSAANLSELFGGLFFFIFPHNGCPQLAAGPLLIHPDNLK